MKETEYNKECTPLIRKKLYELLQFLRSYEVQQVKYEHGRDKSEEEVKYGTTNSSEADITVVLSKLVAYALAQLI